ncbi:hypothetical protein DMI65_14960 [Escherichia coli]|nr:hypothetical protein [Escherichia coli]
MFALLGASGCGKSHAAAYAAGFEQPSAGQIMLDGVDLSQVPYLRPINMMFQSLRAVSAHMTRGTEHRFGLNRTNYRKRKLPAGSMRCLGWCMQEFAKRKPHQLSGGQASACIRPEAL